MTTIYDVAMRNFKAAADMLEALQFTRLDLVQEARNALIGRPRFAFAGGYNDVSPMFGACLPGSGRGELLIPDSGGGVELRCSGTDWMTLEGAISAQIPVDECYLEIQAASDRLLVADVFIRELLQDGTVRDSGHRECHVADGGISVCRLPVPEMAEDVTGRRVIVHLRHPAQRLVIDRLAVTLI